MARDNRYFRLGLLLISGFLLIVAAAVAFGLGAAFQRTIPAETYFAESVEGLEYGSPLKYRGVQIGRVKSIGFVAERYPQATGEQSQYVLVELELFEQLPGGLPTTDVISHLAERIAQGLRVRRTTQGLTGITYLEMDFMDPKRNPLLPVDWTPKSLYIPSAPSTISRLEDVLTNISTTLESISKVNFASLVKSIDSMVAEIDQLLKAAGKEDLGKLLAQNLTQTRDLLARANALLAAPEAETLIPDAARTLADIRRLAATTEQELPSALKEARTAVRAVGRSANALSDILTDPKLAQSLDQLPATLDNVRRTSENLRKSAKRLARLLRTVNELTLSQRDNLDSIEQSVESLTRNLDELADDARMNPSRLILGEPPTPSTVP